jgi:flavodoxin short chain
MANTLLIYGSLTGNTEGVAYKLQTLGKNQDKEIEIKNSDEADVADLQGPHTTLILACSTWDDGLCQVDFADFIERVNKSQINLADKKIAILGCGDSNYVHFCGATSIIEKVFVTEMGGKKVIENLHIDGFPDTEENQTHFQQWAEKLIKLLD